MNLYSFKLIDWKSACWFYSFRIVRKRKSPKRWSLRAFLLDYQDSNLDKQNQNLLCYHYTIVQTLGAFLRKRGKDTIFLKYAPNISLFFCDMNRPFALWSGKNQFFSCKKIRKWLLFIQPLSVNFIFIAVCHELLRCLISGYKGQ